MQSGVYCNAGKKIVFFGQKAGKENLDEREFSNYL